MDKDKVLAFAREAGLKVGANISGVVLVGSPAEIGLAHLTIDELAHFAALVAAAARAEEREACAKLCEEEGLLWGRRYAAAIRARGQASPQTSKPPTQDMVKSCPYYSETLRGAFFDGWIKAEAAHGIKEKNNG